MFSRDRETPSRPVDQVRSCYWMVGLMVAIPTAVAHQERSAMVDRLERGMSEFSTHLIQAEVRELRS
jgi:hypothetical protein